MDWTSLPSGQDASGMSIDFCSLSFLIWRMGLKSPNLLIAVDIKQNSYHKVSSPNKCSDSTASTWHIEKLRPREGPTLMNFAAPRNST